MATFAISLLVLPWGVAAQSFLQYGSLPRCATYNDVCLNAPHDELPVLSIGRCRNGPKEKWHLPMPGNPGPIRNAAQDWLCLTGNESLPDEASSWTFSVKLRTVFLASCDGRPSQDFILPARQWIQGCNGAIKWVLDPDYQLAPSNGEAVLRKMHRDYATWWATPLYPGYVLTLIEYVRLWNALVIISLVVFLIQMLLLLRQCCIAAKGFITCRTGSMGNCAMRLAHIQLTKVWQLLQSMKKSNDAEVIRVYNSNRVARVHGAIRITKPVISFVVLWNLYKLNEVAGRTEQLVQSGMLPQVFMLVWTTFFHCFPRLLGARVLDFSNITYTTTWAVQFGLVRSLARSALNDTLAWMDIMQVLNAACFGNAALATPLQAIIAAVHMYFQIRSDPSYRLYRQATLLVFYLVLIWLIDWQTWTEAAAIVKARQADNGRVMVTRMLDSICDVVVTLDESMCISAAGSPQLACLLMHQGSQATPPLQGARLAQFVAGQDHERFEEFMMRELAAARANFGTHAPITSSLHVQMLDALRIPVSVELFCCCSLDGMNGPNGSMQYLVGIREQETNRGVPEVIGHQSSHLGAMNHEGQLSEIPENDVSSSDDGSSEDSMAHMKMSMWVDVRSEQLQILQWTPRIDSLLHPPPQGAGVLQYMSLIKRGAFLKWLQDPQRSKPFTEMSLEVLPKGSVPKEKRREKRRFLCTADGGDEICANLSLHGIEVVRLDLQKLENKKDTMSILHATRRRRRGSNSAQDIALHVAEDTYIILQSQHAPRSMFQVGSSLEVTADLHQKLCNVMDAAIFESELSDDWQPSNMGAYTLVSSGLRLRAEIVLVSRSDQWQGIDIPCWLMCLTNARLLGISGHQESTHGDTEAHI